MTKNLLLMLLIAITLSGCFRPYGWYRSDHNHGSHMREGHHHRN